MAAEAVRARYATKAAIARGIAAARSAGLQVGGIEIGPDGTIRILQQAAATVESPYDRWKAGREKG